MTPDEYCQDKAAKSGSSFYYSFLFLPPERRRAITALYAFCREVDDVVDECTDPSLARVKLAWWRTQIDQMFEGKPEHPVTPRCGRTCRAVRSRASGCWRWSTAWKWTWTRPATWTGRACANTAGTPPAWWASCRPACSATATRGPWSTPKLGLAFQMTNIIRDVGDDARRGRIYIPVNDMQQFEVKASDILNGEYPSASRR